MRAASSIILVGLLFMSGGWGPAKPAVDYAPTATVREVMRSVVDPSANALRQSVAVTVKTDDGWMELHNRAIALVEATNLLLVPNRHVARPGEKADNPDDERDPQEIEAMIVKDRAKYHNQIGDFREAALKILAAVEARDEMVIQQEGDNLNSACENCHMIYWHKD